MKICVFGLWHLGSVTAACLADKGFNIAALDLDANTITSLKLGKAPIYEPGLNDLIQKGMDEGKLAFYQDPDEALKDADAIWITFDTPVNEQDVADVSFVEQQIMAIMPYIHSDMKIIISSQVPVGFTRALKNTIQNRYPLKKLYFAYVPENLRLGKAIRVFLQPDRIILGSEPDEKNIFMPIFSPLQSPLISMHIESAEMTKHAINTFLATSIVFMNEIASLCESVGAYAKEVEQGLKTEERIGPKAYVCPGAAFAGGTLARDINFLITKGETYNKKMLLFNAVKKSNDYHRGWIERKCKELYSDCSTIVFAVLGLTYKPQTDTLRRSLSIELCQWLHAEGAVVQAFDPYIKMLPPELNKCIRLHDTIQTAINGAHCIIIATEHQLFREIHESVRKQMSQSIIIDPNGFLEPMFVNQPDCTYISIGRP